MLHVCRKVLGEAREGRRRKRGGGEGEGRGGRKRGKRAREGWEGDKKGREGREEGGGRARQGRASQSTCLDVLALRQGIKTLV